VCLIISVNLWKYVRNETKDEIKLTVLPMLKTEAWVNGRLILKLFYRFSLSVFLAVNYGIHLFDGWPEANPKRRM
jgi:hypothetical protein